MKVGRRPRKATAVAALVVGLGLIVGCADGGDDAAGGPSRAAFESRLVEREGITPAQAGCVAHYVYLEYEPGVIDQLYDGGLPSVSMSQWNSFGHSMIACSLGDELGVPYGGEDGEPADG